MGDYEPPILHSPDHLPIGSDAIIDLPLFYVEPLSPAATPADYVSGSLLNTTWEGSWGNVADNYPATGYSLVVGGKTYMQIAATGDEDTTNSLMFVMPEVFWPVTVRTLTIVCGSTGDGLGIVNVYPGTDPFWDGGSVVFVRRVS